MDGVIPAGGLLYLTFGQHSFYEEVGLFRALVDIDTAAVLENYEERKPKGLFRAEENLAKWFIAQDLVEPVEYWDVWAHYGQTGVKLDSSHHHKEGQLK